MIRDSVYTRAEVEVEDRTEKKWRRLPIKKKIIDTSRGDRLGFCYHAPFITEW